MATSGTYTATQSVENIIVEAYERIGTDAQLLTAGHAERARRSIQFMFTDWDNQGIKQWTLEQQSFTVSQGVDEYTLTAGTLDVLDVLLRRDSIDTPINLMTRTEYHSLNDKSVEGRPDRALIQRLRDSVTMTLYYVPENSTDTIVYWRIRHLQDVVTSGEEPDVPRRWWDAIASGLAVRLHEKIPLAERNENWINVGRVLSSKHKDAMYNAQTEDRERADFEVLPASWVR